MIEIRFPEHAYKIREENGREMIFDEIRKQWLVLSPEEWVRQNFVQFLLRKGFPASLLAIEKEIKVGELRRRCDIVVYKNATPWMVVECKEMNVPLSPATVNQVLNYNIRLAVEYLVITNGSNTYAARINGRNAEWIDYIPDY